MSTGGFYCLLHQRYSTNALQYTPFLWEQSSVKKHQCERIQCVSSKVCALCNRVGSQSEKVLAATVHVVEELGRLNKVSDGPRPIH